MTLTNEHVYRRLNELEGRLEVMQKLLLQAMYIHREGYTKNGWIAWHECTFCGGYSSPLGLNNPVEHKQGCPFHIFLKEINP